MDTTTRALHERRVSLRLTQAELDELSSKYVASVDELLKHKESELLEV